MHFMNHFPGKSDYMLHLGRLTCRKMQSNLCYMFQSMEHLNKKVQENPLKFMISLFLRKFGSTCTFGSRQLLNQHEPGNLTARGNDQFCLHRKLNPE